MGFHSLIRQSWYAWIWSAMAIALVWLLESRFAISLFLLFSIAIWLLLMLYLLREHRQERTQLICNTDHLIQFLQSYISKLCRPNQTETTDMQPVLGYRKGLICNQHLLI